MASGKKVGIFVYYNLYYICSTNYSKQKYPLFCLMLLAALLTYRQMDNTFYRGVRKFMGMISNDFK